MSKKKPRMIEEPSMSDRTILVNVEDLINVAFGPIEGNVVDFKLIQTVLHILARELRLLGQDVEIRMEEEKDKMTELQQRLANIQDEMISEEEDEQEGAIQKKDGKKKKGEKKRGKDDNAEKGKEKGEGKGQRDNKKSKKTGKTRQEADKSAARDDDGDERIESAGKKDTPGKGKKKQKDGTEGQEVEGASTRGRIGVEDDKQSMRGIQSKDTGRGIAISEEMRKGMQGDKGKVLVVEKGPTTRDSRTRIGSIEVVSRSEFNLLQNNIQELMSFKGPLPMPTMPDNVQLKTALAKGTATLPDTMEAMQVNARVQAAEKALTCMADLLTQLAAAGAIPPELADRVEQMTTDMQELSVAGEAGAAGLEANYVMDIVGPEGSGLGSGRQPGGIAPISREAQVEAALKQGTALGARISMTLASRLSTTSMPAKLVSQQELQDALAMTKTNLLDNMKNMTTKVSMMAEHANTTAKSVAEKLDIAIRMDERISTLFSLTKDYAEQLSGFGSGLSTQMKSFQEQMNEMRSELQGGLSQMVTANNDTESAAIIDLRTSYDTLVTQLETTLHTHSTLVVMQKQLGDELHALFQHVEMLREQKADLDEVKDRLRDKADLSRLHGLLNEDVFEEVRLDLNKRLDMCYEKFQKQDFVWMGALKDLSNIVGTKAELTQLMGLRDSTTNRLRELYETMEKLEIALGEPKAALVTRQLNAGAACGACLAPALMEPRDAAQGAPAPLARLPPPGGRPAPPGPCTADLRVLVPDTREHTCKRWVGGSHTLVTEHVTRERAPLAQAQGAPSRYYAGYGSDGHLYMLEEELQPCEECNLPAKEKEDTEPFACAAGDAHYSEGVCVSCEYMD